MFALERATKAKRYSSILSLTSALDKGGWLLPRSSSFTPEERDPVSILHFKIKLIIIYYNNKLPPVYRPVAVVILHVQKYGGGGSN